MNFFGPVYRKVGWPFCSDCGKGVDDLQRYEWIPPLNDDGILRIWDEHDNMVARDMAFVFV